MIDIDKKEILIGKIALKHKFLTKEQLNKSISILIKIRKKDEKKSFENILIENGFISEKKIRFLHNFKKFKKVRDLNKEFCKIAVKKGFVSVDDVNGALKTHA